MRNLLAVFMPVEDSRHYHEFAVSLLDALFRQLDLLAPIDLFPVYFKFYGNLNEYALQNIPYFWAISYNTLRFEIII